MPNGTGRNVYLIRQDIDHLYGEYLVRAVVIAPGPGRAVRGLLRHVRTYHPAVIARRSRLTVVRLGENVPERIDPRGAEHAGDEATMVALVFGVDDSAGGSLVGPTGFSRGRTGQGRLNGGPPSGGAA